MAPGRLRSRFLVLPTVRRLIAILLILWLPLQAVAGVFAPVCAHRHAVQVAPLDPGASNAQASGVHAHHAVTPAGAEDRGLTLDDADSLNATASPQCGDCLMACGIAVLGPAEHGPRLDRGANPARHGDEDFASAATTRALEPPITAA